MLLQQLFDTINNIEPEQCATQVTKTHHGQRPMPCRERVSTWRPTSQSFMLNMHLHKVSLHGNLRSLQGMDRCLLLLFHRLVIMC